MSDGRERILAGIRGSLNRGRLDSARPKGGCATGRGASAQFGPGAGGSARLSAAASSCLSRWQRRCRRRHAGRLAAAVPEAVAHYLAVENLPAELVMAPDPSLDAIPWELEAAAANSSRPGRARRPVSLTPCLPRSPRPGR